MRLAEILPADVRVRVVADRGFGDHSFHRVLTENHEVRLRHPLSRQHRGHHHQWRGGARRPIGWAPVVAREHWRGAAVTAEAYPVATVVCVRAKGMKEPWCLAASTADEPARTLINLYKRWEIEGGFRDTKDLRFGMGLGSMHVRTPDRRDRLWLINAFAVVLLTPSAPPEKNWATIGISRPTRPGGALIRCSVRGSVLRTHAEHDRFPPAATQRAVRPDARRPTPLRTNVRCHLENEGESRG